MDSDGFGMPDALEQARWMGPKLVFFFVWFSFPHPSYSLVLPTSDKRPRTAIYVRTEAAIKHKQRDDLLSALAEAR